MAQQLPILRTRGDTYRIRITFTDSSGTPVDFTNADSVVLTVNQQHGPDDAGGEVFSVVGTVQVPETDGIVDFELTGADADHLGEFWYDIELVDLSGYKRTILEGPYTVTQDITKSDEEFVWTPPTSPADGSLVPVVPDTGPLLIGINPQNTATYETRDTRRVIRTNYSPAHAFDKTAVWPVGSDFPRFNFALPGWEFIITGYIDLGVFNLQLWDNVGGYQLIRPTVDTRDGTVDVFTDGGVIDPTTGATSYPAISTPDTTGWTTSGWYKVGIRVADDWAMWGMINRETDTEEWNRMGTTETWLPQIYSAPMPRPNIGRAYPENAASRAEFWKIEWRKL